MDLQQERSFVPGLEGATFDGGLVLPGNPGDGKSTPDTSFLSDTEDSLTMDPDSARTRKFFYLLRTLASLSRIAGVDVKCTDAIFRKLEDGGLYFHKVEYTKAQADCVALVVYSGRAPDLVALVPMAYLVSRSILGEEGYYYASLDHPFTCSKPSSFPVEWSPFVVPRIHLHRCVSALYRWLCFVDEEWSGKHSCLASRSRFRDL